MVNRLWQQHFGRGIVASSSDFGATVDKPTHPELARLAGHRVRQERLVGEARPPLDRDLDRVQQSARGTTEGERPTRRTPYCGSSHGGGSTAKRSATRC